MEFMNSIDIETYGNFQERMNFAEEFLMNPPEETRIRGDWYTAEANRRRAVIKIVLGETCQFPDCETTPQYVRKPTPQSPRFTIAKSKDVGRVRFLDALHWSEALCPAHSRRLRNETKKETHRLPLTCEWVKSPDRNRWDLPPEPIFAELAFFTSKRLFFRSLRPYPHELPEPTEADLWAVTKRFPTW